MFNIKTYLTTALVALTLGCGCVSAYAEPAEGVAQSVATSQPQVRVLRGQIEITVPGDEDRTVTIYALTGQIVKSFNANPGVNTVDLPKGYYIVKCDRVSSRVVVK